MKSCNRRAILIEDEKRIREDRKRSRVESRDAKRTIRAGRNTDDAVTRARDACAPDRNLPIVLIIFRRGECVRSQIFASRVNPARDVSPLSSAGVRRPSLRSCACTCACFACARNRAANNGVLYQAVPGVRHVTFNPMAFFHVIRSSRRETHFPPHPHPSAFYVHVHFF